MSQMSHCHILSFIIAYAIEMHLILYGYQQIIDICKRFAVFYARKIEDFQIDLIQFD